MGPRISRMKSVQSVVCLLGLAYRAKPPQRTRMIVWSGYGVTVKLVTPGPATFDHGPQPLSEPKAQLAPAGQARTMALYTVGALFNANSGTCTNVPGVTPRVGGVDDPGMATKYSYSVAPGTELQPNCTLPAAIVELCAGWVMVGAKDDWPATMKPVAGPTTCDGPGLATTSAS